MAEQAVLFATPDTTGAGSGSRFAALQLANETAVHLGSSIGVYQQLRSDPGGPYVVMGPHTIFARGLDAYGITFDTTRLNVVDAAGITTMSGFTFQNMPTTGPQFRLSSNASFDYIFQYMTFLTAPQSGLGWYLSLEYTGGGSAFTAKMCNPNPGSFNPGEVQFAGSPMPSIVWPYFGGECG